MAGFQPNWAAGWQKIKPKTLLKDTLYKALVSVDTGIEDWKDNGTQESLKKLAAAAEAALKAASQTSDNCNKVLHKDGIKNIEKISGDLVVLRRGVSSYQTSLRDGIEYMKKAASEQLALINAVVAKPQTKVAKVVATESLGRLKKMDVDVKKFFGDFSPGEESYSLRMQSIHRCGMLLDRLQGALTASNDQLTGEVNGCLAEIQKESAKLKAIA